MQRVVGFPSGFTTVGYWFWDRPGNRGRLTIQVHRMNDWRHELAVWGHEIIEAAYCKLARVTTEECDLFDNMYEQWYRDGTKPKSEEPGCDPKCPYHRGHMWGIVWEEIVIFATMASWEKYESECNKIMGI